MLHSAIRTLGLERPILCSWSYGLVPLDYIRYYGDDGLGGLHLVSALTKLGSEDAMSVITPATLGVAPGLFATDAEESVRNLEAFIRMFFARQPSTEDLYLMLGYNVCVPPRVREALFSRSVNNDDLLPKIRKPVLITHGALDAIVRPTVVDRHKAAMRSCADPRHGELRTRAVLGECRGLQPAPPCLHRRPIAPRPRDPGFGPNKVSNIKWRYIGESAL